MTDKLLLVRTLIMVVLLCLLLWDLVVWLNGYPSPLQHRDLLLNGALLWIISVIFPLKNDDDWQLT